MIYNIFKDNDVINKIKVDIFLKINFRSNIWYFSFLLVDVIIIKIRCLVYI